ncbi:hypothetical protein [Algivirga pacifica]|uniref:Lipocalin-like domain-containing protein n=1 Tax=Algivirga pacifica TaxID=1162670 RepID=A0ABP9D9Q7_9BACT
MTGSMNDTQIKAIWDEILHRDDVLEISDLHFVRIYANPLEKAFIVTWNALKGEITIAESLHHDPQETLVEINQYNYVRLKHSTLKRQVLLKVELNEKLQTLNIDPIFNPESKSIALKVHYI